ncbi:hypothetical protein GCK72_013213 [Caenorhabditis remanei]|uniref:Uncharacterized protein n=1 Tax=Caenorhabditis remanei TaxID=31234 RepID=A0A6A5GQL4_CAERE|nr:hypothetical protein GCK72_013213 [Caenorhabditis remanei]KAF1756759.1 hypothetical protein GCK72_013213 [Caenorhabditis remanei]
MAANNNEIVISTLRDMAFRIALSEKRPKNLTEKEMLTYDYFGFPVATKIYNMRTNRGVDKSLTRLCRIELVAHLDLSLDNTQYAEIKVRLTDAATLYKSRGYSLTHMSLIVSGTRNYPTSCTKTIADNYRNLKCLKLVGITMRNRDIDAICGRFPNLIQLDISGTKIPKITKMASMTSLKFLIMKDIIECPRETWINLESAPQLEYLDISQQTSNCLDVTQDFLSSRAVLRRLKTLDCSKTRVTKECLTQLKRRHEALKTVVVLEVEAMKSVDIDGLFLVNTATLRQSVEAMKYCTRLRRSSDLTIVLREIIEWNLVDYPNEILSDRADDYLYWIHRIIDEFSGENDIIQQCVFFWYELCSRVVAFETDMNRFVNHMLLAMSMFEPSTPHPIHSCLWETMKFGSQSDAFKVDLNLFCYMSACYIHALWNKSVSLKSTSVCLRGVEPAIEVMLICTKIAKQEFDPSRKGTPLADRYLDLFFKELFWFLDVHSGIVREYGYCEAYSMICTVFIRFLRRSVELRKKLFGITGGIERLLGHLRAMRTEEVLGKMTTQKQDIPKVLRKVTKMIREICILPDITGLERKIFNTLLLTNIMNDKNTDVNNEFYVASICSTYAFCLELKGVESAEEDMIKYLNARALRLSEKFEFTSCIVYAYLENTIIQEILQHSKITGVVGWAMEVIAMLIFEGHKPSLSYKPSLPPLLPFVQNYKTDDNVLLKIKAHVLEMAEK